MTAAAAVSAAMVAAGMLGIGVAVAQDPPAKPDRVEDGQWCTELRPDTVTGDPRLVPRLRVCFQRRDQLLAFQLREERDQARELVRENRGLRRDLRVRWRPTVQHALALASATYRVDRHLLDRISYCESTYRPTARNGRYVGIAQFGLPLWNSTAYWAFDRTDPYASALGLAEKIREGGLSHWYASRHCWGGAR